MNHYPEYLHTGALEALLTRNYQNPKYYAGMKLPFPFKPLMYAVKISWHRKGKVYDDKNEIGVHSISQFIRCDLTSFRQKSTSYFRLTLLVQLFKLGIWYFSVVNGMISYTRITKRIYNRNYLVQEIRYAAQMLLQFNQHA